MGGAAAGDVGLPWEADAPLSLVLPVTPQSTAPGSLRLWLAPAPRTLRLASTMMAWMRKSSSIDCVTSSAIGTVRPSSLRRASDIGMAKASISISHTESTRANARADGTAFGMHSGNKRARSPRGSSGSSRTPSSLSVGWFNLVPSPTTGSRTESPTRSNRAPVRRKSTSAASTSAVAVLRVDWPNASRASERDVVSAVPPLHRERMQSERNRNRAP